MKSKQANTHTSPGSSPPVTFHILIGKFSYFGIRFFLSLTFHILLSDFYLIALYAVKSDNEIEKVNDNENMI